MSPFNPDGRAVWIHRGHCTFCHEYYVQKCGQDGILAVKFEHQHCCICGGGRGFFFRKEISSTTLTSGYNPNGEPVFVHSGDCHQAFLTSHAALSQRREMAQFMQQLQNLKK